MGKKAAGRGSGASSSSANKLKTDAMPKEEVSKMLNQLKYNASAAKVPDGKKAESKHALDLYRGLDAAGKREFFKRFSLNKKDLAWVQSFTESRADIETNTTGSQQGYFNAHEILAMNGFTASDFSQAERESLVTDLLAECEAIHDITCTKIDHSNVLLCKWFYKKTMAASTTNEQQSKKEHKEKVETGKGENVSADDGGASIKVKLENSYWQGCKVSLNACKSGKQAVAKKLDEAQDCALALEAKGEEAQHKAKEIFPCVETLEAALKEARSQILKFEAVTIDSADATVLGEMEALVSTLSGHVDGAKLVLKRVRAALG